MSELKTIKEIAPILRAAPVTIYRLIRMGELPCTKVGRRFLFSEKNIAEFLTRNELNCRKEVLS